MLFTSASGSTLVANAEAVAVKVAAAAAAAAARTVVPDGDSTPGLVTTTLPGRIPGRTTVPGPEAAPSAAAVAAAPPVAAMAALNRVAMSSALPLAPSHTT